MSRAALAVAVLGISTWGFAQGDKPAAPSAPAAQSAPQGKRQPQAKTQAEFETYKAGMGLADPAAVEKAADDFATKFPDSELRVELYKNAMQKYQANNNLDKMLETAKKALTYDPDDPAALVGAAQTLVQRTRDTDLDKDDKLAEAKKDAERSLVTVDTDIPTAGYPPEQLAAYKGFCRSTAYEVLGAISYGKENWPDAESNFRKSIDAFPQSVDPLVALQLAIALDKQNKISEAMKFVDQAVDLTKDQPASAVGKAAREEKDRLTKLSIGTAPGAAPQKN